MVLFSITYCAISMTAFADLVLEYGQCRMTAIEHLAPKSSRCRMYPMWRKYYYRRVGDLIILQRIFTLIVNICQGGINLGKCPLVDE